MKKPVAVSPLDAHLGYWLRLVSNHVSQSFALRLESEGVSVAEWAALRELLALGATSPSVLAARMAMTRGAVSKMVDRLAAAGFVVKGEVEGDGRVRQVSLSRAGRSLVPRLATLADDNDAACFGHLASDERATLLSLLRETARAQGLTAHPVA